MIWLIIIALLFATPAWAIDILPGADIQAAINANPVATTFVLKAGTHRLPQGSNGLLAKTGDIFNGEPGTILDGSKVIAPIPDGALWSASGQTQQNESTNFPAPPDQSCYLPTYLGCRYPDDVYFDGYPLWRVMTLAEVGPGSFYFDYISDKIYIGDNPAGHLVEAAVARRAFKAQQTGIFTVTVRGLIIQHFASETYTAAVEMRNDWTVENNEVRYNHTTGIWGGGGKSIVRNNNVHHNGCFGITGDGLFENNEVAFNNVAKFNWQWGAGGSKFVYSVGLIVRNNWVHDNGGPGLWTDGGNIGVVYENNLVENNIGFGIFHEISYDAIIRNNTVRNNAVAYLTGKSVYWGAQIYLNTSKNTEIYGNTVTGPNGISLVGYEVRRPPSTGGPQLEHELSNISVHDNIIFLTQHMGAKVDNSALYGSFHFFNNKYYPLGGNSTPFSWPTADNQTIAQWRAFGQDLTSSFLVPPPAPGSLTAH